MPHMKINMKYTYMYIYIPAIRKWREEYGLSNDAMHEWGLKGNVT